MPFCTKCGKNDAKSRQIVNNVCTDCIPGECGNCKFCFDFNKNSGVVKKRNPLMQVQIIQTRTCLKQLM